MRERLSGGSRCGCTEIFASFLRRRSRRALVRRLLGLEHEHPDEQRLRRRRPVDCCAHGHRQRRRARSGPCPTSASLAVGVTPLDVSVNASGSFGADHAGVTYTFDVTCTDSSGAALAHCGPTTNAATASVDWSGNLTLPNLQADVTRHEATGASPACRPGDLDVQRHGRLHLRPSHVRVGVPERDREREPDVQRELLVDRLRPREPPDHELQEQIH